MKLSIIIVNYNTKGITLNCLKSLDKFPFREHFEVVLVDNGSTDGLTKQIKNLKFKHYKLIVVNNAKNLGFSKANNIGIEKSTGEYTILLNSDTLVTKGALDDLVNFAVKNGDAGVVAPKLLNEDLSIQPSVYKAPTLGRTIKQYWLGEKGLLDKYAPTARKPVEVEAVVGAAFLITPAARKKAGLLNDKYFMFFEDLDYCREVRKAGLRVFYLPEVAIIHLHGKSGQSIAASGDQWKRLIPGSKIYHGKVVHYLRWFIMRTSQFIK